MSTQSTSPYLDVVIVGRNDGYGGQDFNDRLVAASRFNHEQLESAGVPHVFTLVEWNPPDLRPSLGTIIRAALPWWHRHLWVSPRWHQRSSTNPRLQFMEFFAKNVAIRRSPADWVLTTNSDVFLSREVIARLRTKALQAGTLYRAERVDIDRECGWRAPSWELLERQSVRLRAHTPRPPFCTDAAGDFLLLDRESYHLAGGFNERVRFAKIYKDGQFCIQCHALGFGIEVMGPIYHIDHDGSFVTSVRDYGPRHELAPYGPWWDASRPYANRRSWGLRGAVERDGGGGVVQLLTPEEVPPTVSLVIAAPQPTPEALAECLTPLLQAGRPVEVLTDSAVTALPEGVSVRPLAPAASLGARLAEGVAGARGRFVVLLARSASVPVATWQTVFDWMDSQPEAATVAVIQDRLDAPWSGLLVLNAAAAVEIAEPVLDFPLCDLWQQATRLGSTRVVVCGGLTAWPHASAGVADSYLDSIRVGLADSAGSSGSLPAALIDHWLADRQRLISAMQGILARLLRDESTRIALWGVTELSRLFICADRPQRAAVVAVIAVDAIEGDTFEGLPVRGLDWLEAHPECVVLNTTGMPSPRVLTNTRLQQSVLDLPLQALEANGTVTHLQLARSLLDQGRDQVALSIATAHKNAVPALEWTWVQATALERVGQLREAARGYREVAGSLHPDRALAAYRLGSLMRRENRTAEAVSWFSRVIDEEAASADQRGGAAFHLGEIARARGEIPAARDAYRQALSWRPDHRAAREALETLDD